MANIKMSVSIDAPPERVFPLAATPQGLARWWAADVSEREGRADLGFFKRSTIYRLQPVRSVAPSAAEWRCLGEGEWTGTRLVFELTKNDGKTRLRFTHADWKAETDYFIDCTATWGELMYRLKATVEGKNPGPLFSAEGLAY